MPRTRSAIPPDITKTSVATAAASPHKSSKPERPLRARDPLTVGEVSQRSGIAVSALHFYESKGLISSTRNAGNQRRYPRGMLRRLAVIRVAQRMGLPLSVIADAFARLPAGKAPTVADWRKLSAAWRDDLDARIHMLTMLRDQLDGCIGCGCLSLKACPLRNPQDVMATQGPGAHVEEGACAGKPLVRRGTRGLP